MFPFAHIRAFIAMYSSEPLPHFVDDYLAYLHEVQPTTATFDGVHTHDDLLEDYSRPAIDTHLRELGSFSRRLGAINPDSLSAAAQLDRQRLDNHVRARIFEIEELRTWERSPQMYADTTALSLAAQALFAYAPPEERARRVLSKLRQVPRMLASARANVKEPAGIFVKTAIETLRGVHAFVERDLPRAFAQVDDLSVLGDLADASTEATSAITEYVAYLEQEVAPKTRGSFRLGKERFQQKLALEEEIGIPAEKLLAIGLRELALAQEEFRRVAARVDGKSDAAEVWRRVKQDHPAAGQLVATARAQVEDLAKFLTRQHVLTLPEAEPPLVGPTPPFYRWTFASMWMPGAFESRPLRSYYYLTDADPSWPAERQEEHLRDFSTAVLWSISMHETYPGHYLHFQRIRQHESKLRKSAAFAPVSFVEGWAHYAEHMMFEQGFAKKDPELRLGQLAESLIRLARLVVGIRLHTEDLSVEQGMRFFRDEAFLEESSARKEAERGTFDPSYVLYALGKLMLLKLRADVERQQGDGFTVRGFHDAVLDAGLVPFRVLRQQAIGGGALLE